MRLATILAGLAAAALALTLSLSAVSSLAPAAPQPALEQASFTRIPGPCKVFCTSGLSCTGQSYCIQGPGGIICDGHTFSCAF